MKDFFPIADTTLSDQQIETNMNTARRNCTPVFVLDTESPFLFVVYSQCLNRYCHSCFRRNGKRRRENQGKMILINGELS